MNGTYSGKHQDKLNTFDSSSMDAFALHNLDQYDWLRTIDEQYSANAVEFADRGEEEFARVLDNQHISWQYKPRTFAVEWDEEGNFVDCFTPDFYLPVLDLYIEVAETDFRTSADNARKVRLLRGQHPEIRIEMLRGDSAGHFLKALL